MQATIPAQHDNTPAPALRSPSALTLAAIDAGVSVDDAHAYEAGRHAPSAVPATTLRSIWSAFSPDFREHNADLRACRVYLSLRGSWTRLGDLSALEAECLLAALTTPRWEVRFYAAPGVSVRRFVSMTAAADFARGRTYRGGPATVRPITRAA